MSSVASPFGLKPAWHPSGVIRQRQTQIASGYAVNIFQYSPVIIVATGFIEAAAAGGDAIGAFMGVEFTDGDGRRRVSNRWLANTVATDIVAYYTEDQQIVYEVQANATLTIAGVGQQFDWSALAGNATTGLSSVSLNVASAAANAGLRVIGLNPGPDNAWGDLFPVLQCQISEHQYVADVASI
jgi:hypothetical protein